MSIIRIDENKLNEAMKSVCYGSIKKIISKKKFKPNKDTKSLKRKISPRVTQIISDLNLHDEPNYEERVKSFTNYCQEYSRNTIIKYFNEAKSIDIFGKSGDSEFIPVYNNFIGKTHTRIVDPGDFIKFISYLFKNFNEYNAPLLIAYYTGLRNNEILRFSMYTLFELSTHSTVVHIKRKNFKNNINDNIEKSESLENYWKPVYNKELYRFIDDLIKLYRKEYDEYMKNTKLDRKLFYISSKTLVARQQSQYYKAIKKPLPYGFGIHGYRTQMSSTLAEYTQNIPVIQKFLQHKNVNTTMLYIKHRFNNMHKEFDRLTNIEYSNIASYLKPKNNTNDDDNDRHDGTIANKNSLKNKQVGEHANT